MLAAALMLVLAPAWPAQPAPGCAPPPRTGKRVDAKRGGFGVKGDGASDDTAALQRAIDAVAGTGGTLVVPAGTYLVDPVAREGRYGLSLGSDMTLQLGPGAVLKAVPTGAPEYCILRVAGAHDVVIAGGALEGDRSAHKGVEGEWGMGLTLSNARNVTVSGLTVRECWGDGFYVTNACADITLCGVVAAHNRRQGLSVVSGDRIVVRGSTFRDTEGTPPACGIDIEPNPGQSVTDLLVTDCEITGNYGGGIGGGPPVAHRAEAFFIRSKIVRNRITGNKQLGIEFAACTDDTIADNVITGTDGVGIRLRDGALRMTVTGNTVSRGSKDGISLEGCAGSVVSGNMVTGNGGKGIREFRGHGAKVSGNSLTGNRD
jgi:parallel beta-helix repeat protein